MRPRNALIALFPPGTVTTEEASEALRRAGGDLESARRELALAGQRQSQTGSGGREYVTESAKQRVSAGPGNGEQKRRERPAADIRAGEGAAVAAQPAPERVPPRNVSLVNNLSDRQYCCVWHVEVYEDGYRPDVARSLLASVARHVNPILRSRGWRVKRLIESASPHWIGLCTGNGRADADAASTNIQLNLRTEPDRKCRTFRSFRQILAVMLHEITHTSIGLEDIHPPAFYELLDEIKAEYGQRLAGGEVDAETDDYGCSGTYVTDSGDVGTVVRSAADVLGRDADLGLLGPGGEGECGASKRRRRRGGGSWKRRRATGGGGGSGGGAGYASNVPKRRPLLKGTKMIDRRTKAGKAAMADREAMTARELAARAALDRLGPVGAAGTSHEAVAAGGGQLGQEICIDSEDDKSTDGYESAGVDEEQIAPHNQGCGCRSCGWDRMLFMPETTSAG